MGLISVTQQEEHDNEIRRLLRNALRELRGTTISSILGIDGSYLSRLISGNKKFTENVTCSVIDNWVKLLIEQAEIREFMKSFGYEPLHTLRIDWSFSGLATFGKIMNDRGLGGLRDPAWGWKHIESNHSDCASALRAGESDLLLYPGRLRGEYGLMRVGKIVLLPDEGKARHVTVYSLQAASENSFTVILSFLKELTLLIGAISDMAQDGDTNLSEFVEHCPELVRSASVLSMNTMI